MDVKPSRRSHRKSQAGAPEAKKTAPDRPAAGRAPPELHPRELRRLNPLAARGQDAPLPSASVDALWSGGGDVKDLEAQLAQAEAELLQVEAELSVAAERMQRLWKKGNAEFRAEVVAELKRSPELTPELRDELAQELAALNQLNDAAERATSRKEVAKIDRERVAVTNEVAATLSENGAELELLQAVERAAGEDQAPGSLASLLSEWCRILSNIFSLTEQLDRLSSRREEEQDRQRDDDLRFAVREVERGELHAGDRLRNELVTLAERRGFVSPFRYVT